MTWNFLGGSGNRGRVITQERIDFLKLYLRNSPHPIELPQAEEEPILLTLAEPGEEPVKLVVATQPRKGRAARLLIYGVAAVLFAHCVASPHGRATFTEHLPTHLKMAVTFAIVSLLLRATDRTPTAKLVERELSHDCRKAVAETTVYAISSSALHALV